jgi:hypothetical protein
VWIIITSVGKYVFMYTQDLIEAGKLMEEVGRPLLMDNQVVISYFTCKCKYLQYIYIYIYNGMSDMYYNGMSGVGRPASAHR